MSNLILPNHLPGIELADDNWDKEPDEFVKSVNKGRQGLSAGFWNGLKRINDLIYGTHRARYYLIGADSGVGKTTLADFMYTISLWLDCKRRGVPIRIVYLSFELSKREKIARWVSLFIKLLFDQEVPSDYIMGRIPDLLLSDDHLRMVKIAKQYVNEFLKDCTVVEGGVHPTWILNHMVELHEALGTVHRMPSKDPKKKGMITGWTPKNPQQVVMMVCDHVALTHSEQGAGLKATIDKLSNYGVMLRNTFDDIIVFLQQFSTDLVSTHRASKKGDSYIVPQRLDFGDSKYTYRDADVVFGLVSPIMFDEKTYKGYDITRLYNYFLACHVMKNRYGPASRMLPLFMNPIAGVFQELPIEPLNELAMEPWYNEVKRLEKVGSLFVPKAA
jgi:hypothetical protein